GWRILVSLVKQTSSILEALINGCTLAEVRLKKTYCRIYSVVANVPIKDLRYKGVTQRCKGKNYC
ncbi:hypothetical protein, partial [Segetibacter aerophilus]|uniref:hypothetical protein n=1 Tax=Segetibacter aerophilus TaxID=670293 RepID=UPI001C3FF3B0